MIRHIALFTFNDATTKAQILGLMTALLDLKNDISQIDRVAWGENFSDRADGHTHVVAFDFQNHGALATFYGHPAHKQVAATLLKPITANMVLVDYEEKDAGGSSRQRADPEGQQ